MAEKHKKRISTPTRPPGRTLADGSLFELSDLIFFVNVPRFEAVCRGYAATLPTWGPPVILPLALKRWGSTRQHGLCSQLAHLGTTSDFVPGSEAVGIPEAAGVV